VTGTPIVSNDTRPEAQPVVKSDEKAAISAPDRSNASIYAAYWQERSGFFSPASQTGRRQPTGTNLPTVAGD